MMCLPHRDVGNSLSLRDVKGEESSKQPQRMEAGNSIFPGANTDLGFRSPRQTKCIPYQQYNM